MAHNENIAPLHVQMVEFGDRLKKFRLSRNLKQQDIADLAGVTRKTVGSLEAGEGATFETLWRVLMALELDDRIMGLIPNAALNPLDPHALKKSERKRASSQAGDDDTPDWAWGE